MKEEKIPHHLVNDEFILKKDIKRKIEPRLAPRPPCSPFSPQKPFTPHK